MSLKFKIKSLSELAEHFQREVDSHQKTIDKMLEDGHSVRSIGNMLGAKNAYLNVVWVINNTEMVKGN